MTNLATKPDGEQFIVAGDRVVEVGYSRGRTKRGGPSSRSPEVHVWTMRDGKVVRFESYLDTVQMSSVLEASSAVPPA